MKKIIYILLTGILLCPSVKTMTQTRNVYWIHGFSGDVTSLEPHDTYFKPLYQMTTYRPVVSTTNGIQGAAQELTNPKLVRSDPNNRNIFVAHSMGGVNSLWLHKLKGSSYVGGLVSMGSPYKGAYVANNILSGTLDGLVADGVKKGSLGIRSEPLVSVTWLTIALTVNTLNALFGTNTPTSLYDVMNLSANKILHNMLKDQVDLTPATLNSLKVGGSDINAIQQYSSFTIPTISLYGTEDYPATLRFISSRLSRDREKPVDVVYIVDKLYQSCASFSAAHSDMATASLLTLNPIAYTLHRLLAANWAVSRDYWNGGIQAATDVLTGCYHTTTVTETYEVWVPDANCDNSIPYNSPEKQLYEPLCTEGSWETTTRTRTVFINEPGDGLVPVTSPQAMPGCLKKVEMKHTNHEEMKYTSASQWYLNEIFAGRSYTSRNSTFFALTAKQ
jgi:hypothetical protein